MQHGSARGAVVWAAEAIPTSEPMRSRGTVDLMRPVPLPPLTLRPKCARGRKIQTVRGPAARWRQLVNMPPCSQAISRSGAGLASRRSRWRSTLPPDQARDGALSPVRLCGHVGTRRLRPDRRARSRRDLVQSTGRWSRARRYRRRWLVPVCVSMLDSLDFNADLTVSFARRPDAECHRGRLPARYFERAGGRPGARSVARILPAKIVPFSREPIDAVEGLAPVRGSYELS